MLEIAAVPGGNDSRTQAHAISLRSNERNCVESQHSSTIAMQDDPTTSRAPIDEDENMDDDDDDAMSNDNGTYNFSQLMPQCQV